HPVAKAPCVAGAVVEHVAEVPAAALAHDLRADHAVRDVLLDLDRLGDGRLGERGPAGARLELRVGREQLRSAACAAVDTVIVAIPVLAGERALCACLTQYGVLLRRKLLAPLGVCLLDLCRHA